MSSSVEQIKAKLDIVTLISSYIKLEKAGANFKGRCPFHNEKTPSFFVSPDRGSYYCFGCHAKGDIFSFVQEFEGLDFIGALKVLAEKTGVTLEHFDKAEKTEKERLFSVLEQALFFYEKKLSENEEALNYLRNRKVTDATIKNFRLGYAPSGWRELYDFLSSKGVTVKDMLSTGVIKKKDSTISLNGGEAVSFYDTFRGRIMFPINDSAGRVVGFSGRILIADEKAPKYLNSPETSLFNKSEILFGLDKAKKDIRLKDYSILVEGQMDLVMLHQAGITNTVASSGTALTIEHLTKLQRLSNRIIMAYDGDSAGFSASDRSAKLALSLGMELKVAQMPEGKDPADMAKDDEDGLKECLRQSKHIIDFFVDSLLLKKMEGRALGKEIQNKVLPYVSLLTSNIEKSHFIKSIAQKTFIKEEALWDDLKNVSSKTNFDVQKEKEKIKTNRFDSIERRIVGIILWQKSLSETKVDISDIEKRFQDIAGERSKKIFFDLEKEKDSLLFETEAYYNGRDDISADLFELLSSLEEESLKEKLSETMVLLQKAEMLRDSSSVLRYLEECQKISQKIDLLKNIKSR